MPTNQPMKDKIKITKEIDRIVHKYPRPDSSELFRSELEYLVEVVKKSLKEPKEDRLSMECKHKDWFEYPNDKWFSVIRKCSNCWYTKVLEKLT